MLLTRILFPYSRVAIAYATSENKQTPLEKKLITTKTREQPLLTPRQKHSKNILFIIIILFSFARDSDHPILSQQLFLIY